MITLPVVPSSDGLFHNGNPVVGEVGTVVSAEWLNAVQSALSSIMLSGYKYDSKKKYRTGEIIFVADDYSSPHVGNYYEAYSPDGCLGKDPRDATHRPDGWKNSDPSAPYFWLKIGKIFMPSCPGKLEAWETQVLPQNRIKAMPELNASKFWRLALATPDNVKNGKIIFPDVRGQSLTYLDDTGLIDEEYRELNSLQPDAIRNITAEFSSIDHGAFDYPDGDGAIEIIKRWGGMKYQTGDQRIWDFHAKFDAARIVPVAHRNRSANTAKLAVRCI